MAIIGIVASFVVPLKVIPLLDVLAAVVFGILGIRRASHSGIGRKVATWGLVLGSVGVVIAVIALSVSSPGFKSGLEAAQSTGYQRASLEKQITDASAKQDVKFTKVECPASPTIKEGNEFHCIGTMKDKSTVTFVVHVEDDAGTVTWKIED